MPIYCLKTHLPTFCFMVNIILTVFVQIVISLHHYRLILGKAGGVVPISP